MRHVDPDVLALLALGEQVASPADREHLLSCAECALEADNLSRAATVGRTTLDFGDLLTPSERVWARISDEVGVGNASVPSLPDDATQATSNVIVLSSRRRWVPILAVAASAGLLAGVGAISWTALQPAPTVILASATLDGFPDWPDAAGQAVLESRADGARVLLLDLQASEGSGFREVWLMNDDATELVSLGVVRGQTGTFIVPDGLDLARFNNVDVSAEPFDGNPSHSSDSIVRGPLES
ncbi:MAG: anti-sigma factor [Salinibacterium sp.]|nr:anti-sigma factor [Salinibacterium sp.]